LVRVISKVLAVAGRTAESVREITMALAAPELIRKAVTL
jgi:hypothetical protein